MKSTDEMNFDEMVAWAKGHILIEIGAGRFSQGVWTAIHEAWCRAYTIGEQAALVEMREQEREKKRKENNKKNKEGRKNGNQRTSKK